MKTLLVLFCAFAFVSATYSPAWDQCGNFSDVWTPTSVTAKKDPYHVNKTLVSACGTVKSHGDFTIFKNLEVTQNVSVFFVTDWYAYHRVVPSGSEFCLNYRHNYATYSPSNVLLYIKAFNILGEEAGCVNITLRVPVHESELSLNQI